MKWPARLWPWLLLYVGGVVLEFFGGWAKDVAGKRIRGEPEEPKS